MLHIISKSLFYSPTTAASIALIDAKDAVLLIGDGIYGATHELVSSLRQVYAIDEDRAARGLARSAGVSYIDYAEMVHLTETHNPVVTWG